MAGVAHGEANDDRSIRLGVGETVDRHLIDVDRHLIDGESFAALRNGLESALEVNAPLGGFELIVLRSSLPIHQVPVRLFTQGESRRVLTQNPFFVETSDTVLRVDVMPEDDTSHRFVSDVEVR